MMIQAPDRDIYVASLSGHVLRLKPGERREVAEHLGVLALQKGCYLLPPGSETGVPAPKPVEVKPEPVPEPEPEPDSQAAPESMAEVDPDEDEPPEDPTERRRREIEAAIRELIKRNDPETLTASGVPRVRDVAVILGRSVGRFEIEKVFQAMEVDG